MKENQLHAYVWTVKCEYVASLSACAPRLYSH